MLRRHVLLFSFILFSVGVILANKSIEVEIVGFVNHLLHLHLDVVFRSFGLFYCGCLLVTLSVIGVLFSLSGRKIISQPQFYFFSSAALVVFYFFFLWKDAVNIPITDDYRVLIFLDQYIQKTTFADKWQLIMQPVNECRIVVPKLYFLGVWKVFGSVNFKWLIMINGIVLLIICSVLFKSFHSREKQLAQLTFLFLILQFQMFDSAFWAFAGVCYYWSFLFVMLAIKAIVKRSPHSFVTGILFAALASFTFGNGLLVFPLACILLLYQGRIKEAIFFVVIMLATVAVYFYNWPDPRSYIGFNPISILIYACGFLGSSVQFMYSLCIPVPVGFLCLGIFIYTTVKKYYRNNLFAWTLLLFIIMTAFLTAPFRLNWSPLEPRYGLYSIAAFVLCLVIIAEMRWKGQGSASVSNLKSRIANLVLILAVCYNLLTGIMFYPEAPVRKIRLENFVNDWKSGRPLTYHPPVIPDEAEKYLNEAKKSGIWNYEK